MDVFGGRTSGRVEDDNVLWEAETIANLPALGVPLSRYLACRRDAFFLVALCDGLANNVKLYSPGHEASVVKDLAVTVDWLEPWRSDHHDVRSLKFPKVYAVADPA